MSPLLSSAYNMLTSISAKDGDAEGAHRLRLLQAEVEKYQHTGLSVGSERVTTEWYKDHMKVKVMRCTGCLCRLCFLTHAWLLLVMLN